MPPIVAGQLLAVDLGLSTGFACYERSGRLVRVGSRRFGSRTQLRGGAEALLREIGDVEVVVLEGDRDLAALWAARAHRRGAGTLTVTPERWRAALLHPRERRSGAEAKRAARRLATEVATELGAAPRTALRHDAAEAVLIGLWGLVAAGWLEQLPAVADPRRR